MSTKARGSKSVARRSTSARSAGRGRRSSRRRDPLVWLLVVPVVIVLAFVLNAWQTGAFARAPDPSRTGDPASLPPLADAGSALHGGHDMALLPEQTPTPQAAPSGEPVPLLHMPTVSYDFGRIYERWDVTHVFVLENKGDADLVIGNLVTSCGCTTADLTSNVIAPGERADLAVTFDADFHPTHGPVTRLVWFGTNDPTQPWVEVRVTADVR